MKSAYLPVKNIQKGELVENIETIIIQAIKPEINYLTLPIITTHSKFRVFFSFQRNLIEEDYV